MYIINVAKIKTPIKCNYTMHTSYYNQPPLRIATLMQQRGLSVLVVPGDVLSVEKAPCRVSPGKVVPGEEPDQEQFWKS